MNDRVIDRVLREARPGSGERVLVAVMNDPRDFAIAQEQGWYRVPVKRAPRQVGADYLAFYFTGAFPVEQRHRIVYFAPIRAYRLATRIDLLPGEPDHPRAKDRYFQIQIGALQQLAHSIPSRRLRRITFISTTLHKLLQAQEINDLWHKGRGQDALWEALKAAEIEAERQVEIGEAGARYVADFVIPCGTRRVVVVCNDVPQASGVNVLHFTAEQLRGKIGDCVRQIREAMAG